MDEKNIWQVICNLVKCLMYSKLTICTLLCSLGISIILPIINYFFLRGDIEISLYCEVLSTIAGFGIASMAILCTMPQKSCRPLCNEIKKHCECMSPDHCEDMSYSKKIDDLFATILTGVLIPLIGLLAYVLRGIPLGINIHTEIKCFSCCFRYCGQVI